MKIGDSVTSVTSNWCFIKVTLKNHDPKWGSSPIIPNLEWDAIYHLHVLQHRNRTYSAGGFQG